MPDTLPSARVLDVMRRDFDHSYTRFIRAQSESTRQHLMRLPCSVETLARFEALSRDSTLAQRQLESEASLPFETWRQAYLAAERLGA